MQSNDNVSLYSYEQWMEKSLNLFKNEIMKSESDFDEQDHKTASECNETLHKRLISLNDAWSKLWATFDLINTLMSYINSKETLHSSGYTLINKIKICLLSLQKIDMGQAKNAQSNAKWFYEFIEKFKVPKLIDPFIRKLEHRLNQPAPALAQLRR